MALVTGANHGIGAATARTLAACGAKVMVSYLRLTDAPDPGIPEKYRQNRAADAEHVHRCHSRRRRRGIRRGGRPLRPRRSRPVIRRG